MIWSIARFQHSYELLPRVLKEVAPLLLPISGLIWGLDFYMSYLNKARFEDPYNSSMMVMIVVGLSGVIMQSFAAVISLIYVARSTQRQMKNGAGDHPIKFLKGHFQQGFIEYLRGFISVGLHMLLLIIPGIIRWIRLVFTVLVSAFDPQYQAGKVDALKESSRLTKGVLFPLFFLLLLQMTLPFIVEEYAKVDGQFTPYTIPLYLTSWLVQLYFAIYFALTFFARHSFKMERA